ncbi:hypothetical protein P261_02255 [Lachnospiraceae bacterium TWA4]|nr:hypothetical protein P261_02255 [Lachnospiraceae bacterium TWA4]
MKDELIKIIANASKTNNHELLIEFLDEYKLHGLKDATEKQLRQFIREKGLEDGK